MVGSGFTLVQWSVTTTPPLALAARFGPLFEHGEHWNCGAAFAAGAPKHRWPSWPMRQARWIGSVSPVSTAAVSPANTLVV